MTAILPNIIAFTFFTLACIILLVRRSNTGINLPEVAPLIISIIFYILVSASNILEHSGITDALDPSEDIAEVLFMLTFIFFVYRWRKQKTIQLINEQKIWLSEILTSIADGILTTDQNGKVKQLNKTMERLTGWSGKDATAQESSAVLAFVDTATGLPIDYNPFTDILENNEEDSIFTPANLMVKSKDGNTTPINEVTSLIKKQNEQIIGAVGVFRDMTEYNRMQEELTHTRKMDAIGQLAGGVAHDINNMLSGVIGAAEIIAGRLTSEELEKYSEIAENVK